MDRINVWYDKNMERRISNIWPPITGEKPIGEPEIYVKETSQQLAKPAVELLNIERDEDMDRTYIPLPGGWEIQTKGKGSTFRIANTKPDAPRYPVIDEFLHEPLEQMARDIRAAYDASKEK